MSSFTDELIISPIGDQKWKLQKPFRYWLTDAEFQLHQGRVITVPAGFITDFASIPRVFWNILPPWGKYGKAAIVHDYLYQSGMYRKEKADRIFLEAMEVLGVSWITRNIMYQAVNWFGFMAWNKHREREKKEDKPNAT